jgi:hypothetical protein
MTISRGIAAVQTVVDTFGQGECLVYRPYSLQPRSPFCCSITTVVQPYVDPPREFALRLTVTHPPHVATGPGDPPEEMVCRACRVTTLTSTHAWCLVRAACVAFVLCSHPITQ